MLGSLVGGEESRLVCLDFGAEKAESWGITHSVPGRTWDEKFPQRKAAVPHGCTSGWTRKV